MKLQALSNRFDEPVLRGRTDSGLTLLVNPRPDRVRTFAALASNFGSVDRGPPAADAQLPAGLAHFLEHKLFEDRAGDVSDRFADLGASANAMTSFSRTSYVFSTVDEPGPCLDLLLDFVQEPYFTAELVEKEQGIIAQEIRMYDDDPDWRIFFGLLGCLYHEHPVRENIAGSLQSIRRIDPDLLQRCYERFYHPANLCLAVSGPVDAADVAERVLRDQAARQDPGRPRHERSVGTEPASRSALRFDLTMPVRRPRLLLGMKDTAPGPDGLAVTRRELATRILLDLLLGRSSAAFEALYTDGLVDESFGASYTAETSFGFSTLGGDTDDPDRLEQRLRQILAAARRDGLDERAFGRLRNRLYGGLLRSLDAPEPVTFGLLSSEFRGVPPLVALDLVEQLTLDDLQQRLGEHVRDEALAVAVVRPGAPT